MPPLEVVPPKPPRRLEPRDEVVRSFVGELPDRLRPTPRAHRLQAALVWGSDQLLGVEELAPGEALTIGQVESARLQVFHPATARGPIAVLRAGADGTFTAFLPVEASSSVRLGGEELSVVQLVERGLARTVHVPVEGLAVELGLHDRATLAFGNVTLVARNARPAGARDAARFGPGFWSRVALYVIGAVGIERMVAMAEPDDRYWELRAPDFAYRGAPGEPAPRP